MDRREVDVLIVGAGPVGLSLALGLARLGTRALVVEKKVEPSPLSRALGVHARTLEIFREWGVADRFLAAGNFLTKIDLWMDSSKTPLLELDLAVLKPITAFPGLLLLPQSGTERILAEAVRTSGNAEIRVDTEALGFTQDEDSVTARLHDGHGESEEVRARYLVGCDGAHSVIRTQLGWELDGTTYPAPMALADIRISGARGECPGPRFALFTKEAAGAIPLGDGVWRLIATDASEGKAPAEERRRFWDARVERLFGAGPYEMLWESPFHIHRRLAARYRDRRVLIAGDAAHLNSPAGGQGMNVGIHDAHNLAWKLARACRGEGDIEPLLSSYQTERRAAFEATVSRYTDWLTRLVLSLVRHPFARTLAGSVLPKLLARAEVREKILPRFAMLTAVYPREGIIGAGRLAGHRIVDGCVEDSSGRSERLLAKVAGKATVLAFGRELPPLRAGVSGVKIVDKNPGVGELADRSGELRRAWGISGQALVLVRPDGYIGWMSEGETTEDVDVCIARALAL